MNASSAAVSELDPSSSPYPLLPPWMLLVFMLIVGIFGFLLNAVVLAGLLRIKRTGFHSIIIQIIFSDVLTLVCIAGAETWARNKGTWPLGGVACAAFLGGEVFCGAAGIYLMATLALHVIATDTLERGSSTNAAPPSSGDTECGDERGSEMRSSRHSLMSRTSTTPPRTISIDYRVRKMSVPVTIPSVFVWILAASLSVPEFSFATTVSLKSVLVLCTFVDTRQRQEMQKLLAVFRFLVPATIVCAAAAAAAGRLRARRQIIQRKPNTTEDATGAALRASLILCSSYIVMNAPCAGLAAAHAFSVATSSGADRYRSPPLHLEAVPPSIVLALACLSFLACALRPLIYLFATPDIRRAVCSFRGIGSKIQDEVII